jgi:hypothetical protein
MRNDALPPLSRKRGRTGKWETGVANRRSITGAAIRNDR